MRINSKDSIYSHSNTLLGVHVAPPPPFQLRSNQGYIPLLQLLRIRITFMRIRILLSLWCWSGYIFPLCCGSGFGSGSCFSLWCWSGSESGYSFPLWCGSGYATQHYSFLIFSSGFAHFRYQGGVRVDSNKKTREKRDLLNLKVHKHEIILNFFWT